MGLDMYLYKRHYMQTADFYGEEKREKVIVLKGGQPHPFIKGERVTYLTEQVGYWRKANAIHAWFVREVQGGRDECQESEVERSKLLELLQICKQIKEACVYVEGRIHTGTSYQNGEKTENYEDGKVLSDVSKQLAEELLPTQSGFFFGGTDYNEYYMQDIEGTIEMLEGLNLTDEKDSADYLYRASW
jgi:hypothetical protein